jgi:hypothetical protein
MSYQHKYVTSLVAISLALIFCGCQPHFSISGPQQPPIDPSSYSVDDYNDDADSYRDAVTPGPTANPDLAKQKRNDIVYGLMSQIDVVYGAYYNHLFTTKSDAAIGSDALTLGLSSAASIATHAATKTIFSALGTGFAGLSLSVDKNYFAQQSFPVIGVAMQTRRDKVRATIVANLASDTTIYPLRAARRDLIAYFNAGTLASGLQELQEEAGAATAATAANAGTSKPLAPGSLGAVGGNAQVSLIWAPSANTTSYNLYYGTTAGVTPANGTKVPGIATNSQTQPGLINGTPYYFVVTAVNTSGESAPSSQVAATPNAPVAAPAGIPAAPSALSAAGGNAQVSLLWALSPGATSYNLYYSTTAGVPLANRTRVAGMTPNPYMQPGLTNGTPYYFVVTAVNASGESPASVEASATPSAKSVSPQLLQMTPH